MKYFIISVAVAGIYLSGLPGKQSAGSHMLAVDSRGDGLGGVCMANLSAGSACQPAALLPQAQIQQSQAQQAQSQQKYVLVRGQLLPL